MDILELQAQPPDASLIYGGISNLLSNFSGIGIGLGLT